MWIYGYKLVTSVTRGTINKLLRMCQWSMHIASQTKLAAVRIDTLDLRN